ncbi:hypothetical protein [Photobacterium leiognathi]|uniref:hypothetical protein n=1 Tax=Photobacterium leiognathi TaxID=553611 RepID=UPI0029823A52|nr:hypothetical protein [Photobacterium leiognathi]
MENFKVVGTVLLNNVITNINDSVLANNSIEAFDTFINRNPLIENNFRLRQRDSTGHRDSALYQDNYSSNEIRIALTTSTES